MPPSMQIDNVSITNYEDLASSTKRATLTFTSSEAVTFSGGNSASSIRLSNVAIPAANTDAANKQYVDAAIMGLAFKEPVRAIALVAGDLATSFAAGSVVDGVTLSTGDRLLLASQTNAVENGIYVVAATGAPARASDLATGSNASGAYTFVDQGTVYKDRGFVCITDRNSAVTDTNSLVFVQFSSRSSAMAGNGLVTGVAEQLDVNVDNATLVVLSDTVQVKDQGIINSKIADTTIQNAKLVNPNVTVNTARGLLGGQLINLGQATELQPDFTVVPDLAAANTFTGANTFQNTVTATGAVSVGGTLAVTGAASLSDNLSVAGTLGVTGATTLSSTLAVSSDATVGGTLGVTGATTLANTLAVTGAATFSSPVTAGRVLGLANPSGQTDAVNLAYMTNAINNATQGGAARCAAVGTNVDLNTLMVGSVVDGVTLVDADRVLLTSQTNPVENGIYVVAATAPPPRASNLAVGSRAAALSLVVKEGTLYTDRLFICTTNSGADLVGTDPLAFTYIAQSMAQMAGNALGHDTTNARLNVRTDDSTMEVDSVNNQLRLKDAGITNAKVADTTIQNAKLVNPNVTVNTARGLLGGQLINLGQTAELRPDFAVVPDLAATNTFAASNNFGGAVHITNTTASTSQSTGALIVDGGVGIAGDLYVSSTYNMSDRTLKDQIVPLDNALAVVEQMTGCQFTWNEHDANKAAYRAGQTTVGVIAQEVFAAGARHCVSQNPDSNLLAVDYTKIVPYLIESCKTLSESVRVLKRRCDDLELSVATKRAKTDDEL